MENDMFGSLDGYQPEKIKDDFAIIKGTFNARFNYFRVEQYDGDVPELQGTEVAKYEIEIIDAGEHLGRRFWKRFYLGSQKADGKGKLDIQKLADVLFTLGFEFKNKEQLETSLAEVVNMTIKVRAWGWKPKPEDEPIQQHTIKGQGSQENKPTGEAPF